MSYLIIELFSGPEHASIVTDENGNNQVFETMEEAEKEAADCQDGLIVEV